MTLVTLPSLPGPRSVGWQLVDPGVTLRGALGGADQRVNRLGGRWAVTVEMPVMTPADARIWAAALSRAVRDGVSWPIRQVGTPTGTPGTPLVNGAGQAGAALIIDGVRAGYAIDAGQWASLLTAGQRYLYQAVQALNGSGTLQIEPPLRAQPADNDPVEIANPLIEGLLSAPQGWSLDPDWLARGFTFTISETR